MKKIAFFLTLIIFLPLAKADWPTYQHDEMNTGFSEETLPENLNILWSFSLNESCLFSYPIYADGKVFVKDAYGFCVYALNPDNGKIIWKKNLPFSPYISTGAPLYENGTLYVAKMRFKWPYIFTHTYIYALNASNGKIIWNVPLFGMSGAKASMKFYKGKIIYGLQIGRNFPLGILYVINASNGKIIWKKFTLGAITGSVCIYNGKIYVATTPATHGQRIPFFITNRFRDISCIYCFDFDGNIIWKRFVIGQAKSSVTASYGNIYFPTFHYFNKITSLCGGIVYAFNASNGNLIWKKEIIHRYGRANDFLSDMAIAYGKIYVNGWWKTFCLDAFTGEIIWNRSDVLPGVRPPVVCSGRVFVGGDNEIVVIDANNGNIIQKIKFPSETPITVEGFAIADKKIFATTFEGIVYAIG